MTVPRRDEIASFHIPALGILGRKASRLRSRFFAVCWGVPLGYFLVAGRTAITGSAEQRESVVDADRAARTAPHASASFWKARARPGSHPEQAMPAPGTGYASTRNRLCQLEDPRAPRDTRWAPGHLKVGLIITRGGGWSLACPSLGSATPQESWAFRRDVSRLCETPADAS